MTSETDAKNVREPRLVSGCRYNNVEVGTSVDLSLLIQGDAWTLISEQQHSLAGFRVCAQDELRRLFSGCILDPAY
jgi:hypothetical protein